MYRRRRAFRRHPSYPAFIAADGSPYDAASVVTASGWCVDVARLRETVRHYAPQARFTDLSLVSVEPESGGLVAFPFEVLAGLTELIGWRRLGWLFGVIAAGAVLAVAAVGLGTEGDAPIGVAVGALALALLGWRAAAVRRRRRLSAHPEAWLGSDREDGAGGRLTGLRRGRLAASVLRLSPLAGRRSRRRMPRRSRAGYPLR
ncbi:MAG TPA: hypothetical protein VHZ33_29550 [Trebonia sp.]|nr:hypothetical protein [Trebonia sp.]